MSISTIPVDDGRIAYRRLGSGRPLLVLNGLAATSADWDPSFIGGLAAANDLVLLDNRGIGASTDNGAPFDIRQLADDTARVIEALEFERASVLGWSLGGFIAQTLALDHHGLVDRLILLSTDPGGADAELASPDVRSRLADMSGTRMSKLVDCFRSCFPAILPSPSTRSSATSLRPRAHSCLLTSSAGRLALWTLGIALAPAIGSGS